MITLPLVLLAIPSVLVGWTTIGPMVFGDWFGTAIHVNAANDVLAELAHEFHGAWAMTLHGFKQPPFWIALAGFLVATWIWLFNPGVTARFKSALKPIYSMLVNKYWIDELYQAVFARGGIALGRGLWKGSDAGLIDGVAVNGSVAVVDRVSMTVRWLQSGYLYHYAFAMILGLIALLGGVWWVAHTAL